MIHARHICMTVTLLLLPCIILASQDKDDSLQILIRKIDDYYRWHPQELRTQQDKFRITPTYGAVYTQETGLMGMGGFTGTYRGTMEEDVPFSTISVSAAVSTKLYLMTAVQGIWHSPYSRTWLRHLRIKYDASAGIMPERFYGIGYECGQIGEYGEFRDMAFRVNADIMFKAGILRIGPVLGFDMMRLDNFTDTFFDEDYSETYSSFTGGLTVELDTRDKLPSPSRGIFLNLCSTASPSFGSGTGFHNTVTADFFIPLWKGGCLATDIYGDFSSTGAYWMRWGGFGGDSRMRGYYTGRYRDRNHICIQAEVRHWFSEMHGAVIWGGAGTIFPDFSAIRLNRLLPTFGAGYRLNFQNILLRLDAGFGSGGQWSVSAGFGQAF